MAKYKVNENDPDTYVVSKLNSKKYTRITHTHTTRWGLSLDDYMKKFNIQKDGMISKQLQNTLAFTKDRAIEIYGVEIGNKKWDEYREKQSLTNTFEYKNQKYGMTKDEFDNYNASRAVTLDNLIKRHGEEVGNKKWDEYRKRQAYAGCSVDYFTEKYGSEDGIRIYEEINKKKSLSLDNLMSRYGEKDGHRRYHAYMEDKNIGYSRIAKEMFDKISPYFIGNKIYYMNLEDNKEFGLHDVENKRYYFYDYIDYTLKKGIEFNGDVFHGNPRLFESGDTPNPFNKDAICEKLWEYDRIKIQKINEIHGIEILTIWEYDYNQDREGVISKCVDFFKK
jgi:hypothetical protein